MSLVRAFVLIRVGTGEHLNFSKLAKEKIENISGVVKVHLVFGRYDLIAEVDASDLEQLSSIISDKIRAVTGVLSTESLIEFS